MVDGKEEGAAVVELDSRGKEEGPALVDGRRGSAWTYEDFVPVYMSLCPSHGHACGEDNY